MSTNGFYRKTSEFKLQYASLSVYSPSYILKKEDKDAYQLPIDGWNWYENRDDAIYELEPYPSTNRILTSSIKKGNRIIDKANFLLKFTTTELEQIYNEKVNNHILNEYWNIIEKSDRIDLENTIITDLFVLLVKWNIITLDRKIEILG